LKNLKKKGVEPEAVEGSLLLFLVLVLFGYVLVLFVIIHLLWHS
jgi:hypothetical protein